MTLPSNPVLDGAVTTGQPWPTPPGQPDRAEARSCQTGEQVSYGRMESPLGPLWIVVGSRGVRRVMIGEDEAAEAAELPPAVGTRAPEAQAVQPAIAQLTEYFRGARRAFDLAVDLSTMSPFQQTVLQEVSRVPAGQVVTYGELAARLGRPAAARAVGNALGANPIPIIVPCHRVVRRGGHLGGYTGGLDRKRFLLRLEGAL